jgi:hypothetical protein
MLKKFEMKNINEINDHNYILAKIGCINNLKEKNILKNRQQRQLNEESEIQTNISQLRNQQTILSNEYIQNCQNIRNESESKEEKMNTIKNLYLQKYNNIQKEIDFLQSRQQLKMFPIF